MSSTSMRGPDRELSDGGYPEWSPDGNEIATAGNLQLSIERADGSSRRVVPTSALVGRILWLVHVGSDRVRRHGRVHLDGSPGRLEGATADYGLQRHLVARRNSPRGLQRGVNWPAPVVVVRAEGGEVAVIAQNADSIPGWSPNGTKLAFRADGRLRIADAAGGQQTTGPTIGLADPEEIPAWSPDGQTILIGLVRDDLDVFGFDARSGSPRPLLTSATDEFTPAFSPDGERVLVSKRSGGGPLYVARPHGHGQRKLANIDAVGGGAWSPDGSQIAYVSRSSDLHVADMGVNSDAGKVILDGVDDGSRLLVSERSPAGDRRLRGKGSLHGWRRWPGQAASIPRASEDPRLLARVVSARRPHRVRRVREVRRGERRLRRARLDHYRHARLPPPSTASRKAAPPPGPPTGVSSPTPTEE